MRVNLKMLILALSCWIGLSAHAFIEDGIVYQILSESDRTLEVVRNEVYEYAGDLVIPQKIIYKKKTYTVISIGEEAFYECSELTSVSIPNTVSNISGSAFNECRNMTAIIVSEDNNNYADIEGVLFDKNLSKLIRYPEGSKKTEYSIPNSVSTIYDYAFYDCSGLTSVSIPNSVTSIGSYVFYGCSGLTSVSIPNSVTSIGSYAFYGCSGLTSVSIPNSVTSIGEYAFSFCLGLTSVSIPNSVTSINDSAFSYCSGLTSVSIPNSVTSIGSYAFSHCSGLTSVSIPNSVTSIGEYYFGHAFSDCTELTSVSIPNSVSLIGRQAFDGCRRLTSVYIEKETALQCDDLFSEDTLKECVLYIPKGSRASYESTDPWRNFWNIEEMEFSGVEEISEDSEEVKISVKDGTIIVEGIDKNAFIEVYSLNGSCVYRGSSTQIISLTSGMYLVRVGDNSQKVIITD